MEVKEIVELGILAVVTLGLIATLVIALVKGKLKNEIIEAMKEAEEVYKDEPAETKGIKKLQYVIDKVKEKYKILTIVVNIQTFVEKIIEITKKINYKNK